VVAVTRLGRRGLAAVVGLGVGTVGVLGWVLARGWYLADYCFTRAPRPPGVNPGSSVDGPSFDSPLSLRCDWAVHRDVVVVDPVPLLGLLLVVLLALAAALLVLVRTPRTTED
jgi:hypothetical protein